MNRPRRISLYDVHLWPAGPDTPESDPLRAFTGVMTGSLLGSVVWLTVYLLAFAT